MAAATDPSSNPHSLRFRRNSRNLSSPWSQIVRGDAEPSEAPAPSSSPSPPSPPAATATSIAPPEAADRAVRRTASPEDAAAARLSGAAETPTCDCGDHRGGGNGNAAAPPSREKKSAWNRPSNGLTEAEPVMGAVSWPALSEATKASPKSSSSESLKGFSDGSVFAPPASGVTSPPSKPTADTSDPNTSTNYAAPARQKSTKRGSGSGSGSAIMGKGVTGLPNGRSAPPVMPPTSVEASQNLSGKLVSSEPTIRDLTNKSGSNWDHGPRGGGFFSQLHGGNENHRNYGGNMKRGNNAVGGHHHNFGNRRDQERRAYDWNHHRPFGGGREMQMPQRPQHQPRAITRPFLRPPPLVSAPFVTPPPRVSPFGSPIGYHDIPSPLFYVPTPPPPESLGGIPFVAPPAMFFAAPDPQLQAALAKQIEYYFSSENLCKDIYLRQNMDKEGWVPISLIASFNRVRNLTNNIQFILDTLKISTVVEVQGDKMRRRNDWMNWPPLAPTPNSTHSSALPSYDALVACARNVGSDEGNANQNIMMDAVQKDVVLSSSSGESNSKPQMEINSDGDGSRKSTAHIVSERSCLQEA